MNFISSNNLLSLGVNILSFDLNVVTFVNSHLVEDDFSILSWILISHFLFKNEVCFERKKRCTFARKKDVTDATSKNEKCCRE